MPTELHLADGSPATADADAVVIGLLPAANGEQAPRLAPGASEVAQAFGGEDELVDLLTVVGATGKADEVVKLPTRGATTAPLLVAAGLGAPDEGGEPHAEQVRRASGSAARALAGSARAVSTLGRIDLAAAAEGTLLGAYAFTEYRSNGNGKDPVGRVGLVADGDRSDVLRTATAVATAVRTARDLVNTPPNDLYPETFAARARELAEAAGVEVEVLDDAALADGGYGGVLGVGGGSARKPRLVKLTYVPEGVESPTKVALVGKGITFDTGGISIKPAAGMWEMKSDMAGAAAVGATMLAVAALKPGVAVTGYLAMAEN
ncbi:MAG TPA: M17 family peptidase N-terminal domain-containing protein, partial [Pseudonocardia sp.]|nr:M17 family peptidase N-terminal domain-containing protein [Pseudonocardia sp.]